MINQSLEINYTVVVFLEFFCRNFKKTTKKLRTSSVKKTPNHS